MKRKQEGENWLESDEKALMKIYEGGRGKKGRRRGKKWDRGRHFMVGGRGEERNVVIKEMSGRRATIFLNLLARRHKNKKKGGGDYTGEGGKEWLGPKTMAINPAVRKTAGDTTAWDVYWEGGKTGSHLEVAGKHDTSIFPGNRRGNPEPGICREGRRGKGIPHGRSKKL